MKVSSTKCIAECRKCITKCQKCCQMNKNKANMKECCKCCKCCIIICKAVCEMLRCDDNCDMTKRLCMLCVACCKKCATQCAKFKNNKACKDCSIACKRCETACKKCGNSKSKSITKKGGGNGNGSVATIVNNPHMSYANQLRSTVILVELYDITVPIKHLQQNILNGRMEIVPHNRFAEKSKSYFITGSHMSIVDILNKIGEAIFRRPSEFYFKTSDTELGHKAYERGGNTRYVSFSNVCERLNTDTPENGPKNMSYNAIFENIPQLMEYGIIKGPSLYDTATSGKTIYDYIDVVKTDAESSKNVYTLEVYVDGGMLKKKLEWQVEHNKKSTYS